MILPSFPPANETSTPYHHWNLATFSFSLQQFHHYLHNVQIFAGRTVTRNWTGMTELQPKLNWLPLQTHRRHIIKLELVYCNHSYSTIRFCSSPFPLETSPHNKILFQPCVSTLSHHHSFMQNSLSSFIYVHPIWILLFSNHILRCILFQTRLPYARYYYLNMGSHADPSGCACAWASRATPQCALSENIFAEKFSIYYWSRTSIYSHTITDVTTPC